MSKTNGYNKSINLLLVCGMAMAIIFTFTACSHVSRIPHGVLYESSLLKDEHVVNTDSRNSTVPKYNGYNISESHHVTDDCVLAYFENAINIETHWADSPFTTLYIIEPLERKVNEPPFVLSNEIVVYGELIDAPAPRWMHMMDGLDFVGMHNGGEVYVLTHLPVIMLPLMEVAEALGYDEVSFNEDAQEVIIGGTYKLWVGESQAYFIDESRMIFLAAELVVFDGHIFVPASFFGAQIFDSQVVIDPYSKNRVNEVVLGIALATDELLGNYNSYVELVEPYMENHQRIIIVPNVPLSNFRWIEIRYGIDVFCSHKVEIYETQEISPEQPFVVTWHEGEAFPNRGISFIDEYGTERFFLLNVNNASFEESFRGQFILTEC